MFLMAPTAFFALNFEATGTGQQQVNQKTAPSLNGATNWFNSQPLNLKDLRGNVVLIDFWTYTCINWRRTLPYIREWESKYRDQGLVVIGVHTPEFKFEYKMDNESLNTSLLNNGNNKNIEIDSTSIEINNCSEVQRMNL